MGVYNYNAWTVEVALRVVIMLGNCGYLQNLDTIPYTLPADSQALLSTYSTKSSLHIRPGYSMIACWWSPDMAPRLCSGGAMGNKATPLRCNAMCRIMKKPLRSGGQNEWNPSRTKFSSSHYSQRLLGLLPAKRSTDLLSRNI